MRGARAGAALLAMSVVAGCQQSAEKELPKPDYLRVIMGSRAIPKQHWPDPIAIDDCAPTVAIQEKDDQYLPVRGRDRSTDDTFLLLPLIDRPAQKAALAAAHARPPGEFTAWTNEVTGSYGRINVAEIQEYENGVMGQVFVANSFFCTDAAFLRGENPETLDEPVLVQQVEVIRTCKRHKDADEWIEISNRETCTDAPIKRIRSPGVSRFGGKLPAEARAEREARGDYPAPIEKDKEAELPAKPADGGPAPGADTGGGRAEGGGAPPGAEEAGGP